MQNSKPRIYMRHGIWCCKAAYIAFGGQVKVMGHGYSPQEAYSDWAAQWWRTAT